VTGVVLKLTDMRTNLARAMVDTNLQRETILPGEKAKSYKMRLEAMKWQAERPIKDNSSPVGMNYRLDHAKKWNILRAC